MPYVRLTHSHPSWWGDRSNTGKAVCSWISICVRVALSFSQAI
jgi:hypothetical protein